MKKILLTLFMASLLFPLTAEEQLVEDREVREIELSTAPLEGRAKAGVALGYPTGLVFGYRLANWVEVNALAGTYFDGFTLGGNMLFTLADIKIRERSFPLSVGPQVNAEFGNDFGMSVLGMVRWEHTLEEIPLNLYLEGGAGVSLIDEFGLAWAASLGIRYVF
jgi:hypothetical protein